MSATATRWVRGALLAATLAAALSGCATAPCEAERPAHWAQPITTLEGIPNLHRVAPGLYRSGQPTAEGLARLGSGQGLREGEAPIRTVLSLRRSAEDRERLPPGSSLRLAQIPMDADQPLREADLLAFLRIATDPQAQPLLVHCRHGADRTGSLIAAYRMVIEQWSKEAAIAEMRGGCFGFHPLFDHLADDLRALDVEGLRAKLKSPGR